MKTRKGGQNKESDLDKSNALQNLRASDRLREKSLSKEKELKTIEAVDPRPRREEEKPRLLVSIPIDIFNKYLENKKAIMSKAPRGRGRSFNDPNFKPNNVKKPRAKKTTKLNTAFPNALENTHIYHADAADKGFRQEINYNMQSETEKRNDFTDQGTGIFEMPYMQDITIQKLPRPKTAGLREQHLTSPISRPAKNHYGGESTIFDLSGKFDAMQNTYGNVATPENTDSGTGFDVLNLSKTKDETTVEASIVLSNDEKNLITTIRSTNINLPTLNTLIAKGDLNNNSDLVKDLNNPETIDLVDDDDDDCASQLDPKVLKTLEDQSESNKKFISLLLNILTTGYSVVSKMEVKAEVILHKLNMNGVDVLKLVGLLNDCMLDYVKTNKPEPKVLVDKSTETTAVYKVPVAKNPDLSPIIVETATQIVKPTQIDGKTPHCPSQDVHKFICRPSHQYFRKNQTAELAEQSTQMCIPQQASYTNVQPMMPQQNYTNAVAVYSQQQVQQAVPQTQNIYQNEDVVAVQGYYGPQQAATGYYPAAAAYPNPQQQQFTQAHYNAQRSGTRYDPRNDPRNRVRMEVPPQNLGNLYW